MLQRVRRRLRNAIWCLFKNHLAWDQAFKTRTAVIERHAISSEHFCNCSNNSASNLKAERCRFFGFTSCHFMAASWVILSYNPAQPQNHSNYKLCMDVWTGVAWCLGSQTEGRWRAETRQGCTRTRSGVFLRQMESGKALVWTFLKRLSLNQTHCVQLQYGKDVMLSLGHTNWSITAGSYLMLCHFFRSYI